MTTQIPPDFEDRHVLARELCEHLSINTHHVDLDSLRIELGPDSSHVVTWTGHARFDLSELTAILISAVEIRAHLT